MEQPRAGYLETDAKCPQTGGVLTVYLSIERMQKLLKYGPAHRFHEAKSLLREVLESPDRIYEYRDDDYEGYCYVANMSYAVKNDGSFGAKPDRKVFVVFVSSNLVIGDFGWEECDADDGLLPLVHADRLRGKIWP